MEEQHRERYGPVVRPVIVMVDADLQLQNRCVHSDSGARSTSLPLFRIRIILIACAIKWLAVTQSRELGAPAPTDTTAELLGEKVPAEWNRGTACFSHDECGADQFCMWTWCNSWEGWFFVCGESL